MSFGSYKKIGKATTPTTYLTTNPKTLVALSEKEVGYYGQRRKSPIIKWFTIL
jgi:hypothetical protein